MSTGTRLEMKVDMNIIQHLGISMYATLPPVIAELVSNAWDADASEVWIELFDINPEDKKIIVRDDGMGMSIEDIQNSFLVIGKNRRKDGDVTPKGRKVIGRKGIGKLSMFGIADEIIVTSVKKINGKKVKNRFKLNLNEIKNSGTIYHPPHEIINQETDEPTGTTIEIMKIRRKSPFDAHRIAIDLARRFLIFDDNFRVWIKHNDEDPIEVKQDLRFEGIDIEFEWTFPNSNIQTSYEHANKVKGKVFTAKKPVPEDMKGIYLIARGKLVHRNDFYGIRSSDYAHAYLTGWLEVDFIDEKPEEDNIATNRQELTWEKENLQQLRKYLQEIISFVTSEWRRKRKEIKENKVHERTGINISGWIQSLDPVSKPIARKLVNSILSSDTIDEDRASEMIYFIHDMFEFDSFRRMAADIVGEDIVSEDRVLELMKKWELVEAREMYKLSQVRIDTITNFEKLIQENAREVPTLHEFFKKFPWLLDPRIMEFRDEVTYSKLLKEKFPERDLEEKNRRIDFLCVRFGGIFFVIELKRPQHTLQYKDIEQAKDYRSFIEQHLGTEHNERVIAYIVVGKIPDRDRRVIDELDTQKKAQKIFIRTYYELLQNAKNYHREFIEKYQKLKEKSDSYE